MLTFYLSDEALSETLKIEMSKQNIYHVGYSYVSVPVNLAKSESCLADVAFSLWALI